MKSSKSHRAVWISSLFLTVFAAGFYAASAGLVGAPDISIKWGHPDKFSYQSSLRAEGGAELILRYLGSSGCVYSNKPDVPYKINRLKNLMQNQRKWAEICRNWNILRIGT